MLPSLEALRELYAFMRENHVLYARCGELELRLGPMVAVQPVDTSGESSSADPDAELHDSIGDLLYSSGVDPAPFVEAMRAKQ